MRRRKSAQRNLFRSAAFDNSHRGSEARLKRSLARKRGSSAAAAAEAQNNFNFEKLPQVLLALWCTRKKRLEHSIFDSFLSPLKRRERPQQRNRERERERTARALILPSPRHVKITGREHVGKRRKSHFTSSFLLLLLLFFG